MDKDSVKKNVAMLEGMEYPVVKGLSGMTYADIPVSDTPDANGIFPCTLKETEDGEVTNNVFLLNGGSIF